MILNKEELTKDITERINYLNALFELPNESEICRSIILGRILELNNLLVEIKKYI